MLGNYKAPFHSQPRTMPQNSQSHSVRAQPHPNHHNEAEYFRNVLNSNHFQTHAPCGVDPRLISHNVHMHYDITVTAREHYEMNMLSHSNAPSNSCYQSNAYSSTSYPPYLPYPTNQVFYSNPIDIASLSDTPTASCSTLADRPVINLSTLSPQPSNEMSRLSTPSPPLSLSPYLPDGYNESPSMESLTPSLVPSPPPYSPMSVSDSSVTSPGYFAPLSALKAIDHHASSYQNTVDKNNSGLCPDSGYASPSPEPINPDDKSQNKSSDSDSIQLQELTNVNLDTLGEQSDTKSGAEMERSSTLKTMCQIKNSGKLQKPEVSFVEIISHAILSMPDEKILLNEIYDFCVNHYEYFRSTAPTWKNSIRHNLSINECFTKSGRAPNGKGSYWIIHPACVNDFRRGDFNRRKARTKIQEYMRSEIRANVQARRMRQRYGNFMHSTPKSNQRSFTNTETKATTLGSNDSKPLTPIMLPCHGDAQRTPLGLLQENQLVHPNYSQWPQNSEALSNFASYISGTPDSTWKVPESNWSSARGQSTVSEEYNYSMNIHSNEIKTLYQL